MSKFIDYIITPCLLFGTLMAENRSATAAPASLFPTKSVLSEGKWVKIHINKTGVYELTQEEVQAMGFADLNSIGIYGRGGGLQPTQFVNATGDAYMSDLQPVTMKYRNGKVYFFAQANQKVRYCWENDSRANAMRFDQESNQSFSDNVVYFITDLPKKRQMMPLVSSGLCISSLPSLSQAWAYSYHEEDNFTIVNSGREFFGESFVEAKDAEQSFPYYIPGAVTGSQAGITALFAARSSSPSTLEYGFNDGVEGSTDVSSIPASGSTDNYKYNSKNFLSVPINNERGEVVFKFNAPGNDASVAALDYFVVGAKRKLAFQENESQFMVFPYEYTSRKYRWMELEGTDGDLGVWQVTNSNDVKELSYERKPYEGKTYVKYLGDNHKGSVIFLDYSQPQYHINGYEPVMNQNLHALGVESMPAMVIITLPQLKPAADRLAMLHKQKDGIDVAVVLHSDVVNEFSAGVDDPMAYRALAKMLYDRDNPNNRIFKNILLFGPNVRDQRNILGIVPEIGTLISNQTYTSSSSDYAFCMDDWYGMMDDITDYEQTSAYNFCKVPMQIGVGIIPVNDLAAANAAVSKIEKFYADDSFAYWLGNYNYIADGGDDNEHQNWQEALWDNMDLFTNKGGLGTKIYNNLCARYGSRSLFLSKINEGSMLSFYTGHATSENMSSEFFDMGDERKFTNTRFGMALLGACSLSPFDNNTVGVGTKIFNLPETGFIAVITSSRSGYSRHNYNLLDHMQSLLMLDDIESGTSLSAPRTLGEVYAMAKSAVTNHSNKFVFHLLGDPAIKLPTPTAEVSMQLEGVNDNTLYPGSEVQFTGTITDRAGNLIHDYNGTVVVKLCAPKVEVTTNSRQGSRPVKVGLEQTTLYITAFDVVNGKFVGSMLIPSNTPEAGADSPVVLRMSAYDATSRIGAIGAKTVAINPYDSDKAVSTDFPPTITAMYANDPAICEADALPSNFMLHADISDDYGVMAYDVNGISSMYLTIDGRLSKYDLNSYITVTDGGKSVHLSYPLRDLAPGIHQLCLTASDVNSQVVTNTINVKVGNPVDVPAMHLLTEGPARTEALLQLDETQSASSYLLRILDAHGNIVYTKPMKENSYTWNLKDNNGVRVPEGVYYAVSVKNISGKGTAVSKPCEIIVF